jgi:hypothetical protein
VRLQKVGQELVRLGEGSMPFSLSTRTIVLRATWCPRLDSAPRILV